MRKVKLIIKKIINKRKLFAPHELETNKKLYVLVSNKLVPIYGAVQGGHVIAQFLIEHPNSEWQNDTVVYLSCDLDKFINQMKRRLYISKDEEMSVFKEPDLNNQITAIACYKIPQNYVRHIKLLK